VDVRDIKAKLSPTHNPVNAKLSSGSDRTSGASQTLAQLPEKQLPRGTNQDRREPSLHDKGIAAVPPDWAE